MMFREFNYFFFKHITFDQFYNNFRTSYDFQAAESVKRIYNDWLILFCHRASLFYRAQYEYHERIIQKEFSIENGVPEGHSFSEYGLDDRWEYYSDKNGLTAHYHECENQRGTINSAADWARMENNIPYTYSMGEVVKELETARNEIILRQRPQTRTINEFWFNSTINNPDDTIAQLRKMSYPDYLKTRHWQNVRAAMMLIHKASCQAEGHYEQFESWYFGWEPEIDVHHLDYRNKGNERYSDLALLCKDHHKLWHSNITNLKPQITILDAD
jgi:hypothetical protein